MTARTSAATLLLVRRALLATLLLGLLGIGTELLLIEHTEDAWQWAPLGLIAAALLVIIWHAAAPGRTSLMAIRATMLLFIASGFVGTLLHYRGNTEFELERSPELGGFALFGAAMTGATPALAPGTMILLGLLGLTYAFRHPSLVARSDDSSTFTGTSR